ncbi:MAG: iron-sulfur cluster repair di-iron protein [Nitrospinota bacterium]
MNTQWSTQTPVGDFVKDNVLCAKTFEDLSIDFCCGGANSLEDACQEKGLKPKEILNQLQKLENLAPEADSEIKKLTPGQLTEHIEEKHHKYLKDAFPRIASLMGKVLSAHGGRHPELQELQTAFTHLREDLEPHLVKEERVLFPLIKKLEFQGLGNHMKATAGPIRVMLAEHDRAGELLKKIREITSGFKTPEDGCGSFNALYEELKFLEEDTHLHIHKENNILFSKLETIN